MIAIVGAGVAGISAAVALREHGCDDQLRVIGAEPSFPYDRPTLSKSFLTNHDLTEPPALVPPQRLTDLSIELALGDEALAVDRTRRKLLTSRQEIDYDLLLLATGSEARRFDGPGAELLGVHHLRDVDDARSLRTALQAQTNLVVVGGGPIGLEVAASAVRLGVPVTVLEIAPRLMGRIGPDEFAKLLEDVHRTQGVTIRTDVVPIGLEGSAARVRGVRLEDGQFVPASIVLVGVGSNPRTGLAERAGLAVENGIAVNEQFQTVDERIYAVGDAARVFHAGAAQHIRMEQWRPAQRQGELAAASMLGIGEPYRDVPSMWSDQHGLHIQAAGFSFLGADVMRRGDLSQPAGVVWLGVRDGRVVAACGASIGTGIARTIRAAQILIEARTPVEIDELVDPHADLRRLARSRVA